MKFLIVVDMQNDFITGSLGTKEAEAILPKVLEKIRTYRPEQIFVTQDTHPDNYLETNEGRHLPVAHCIAGSQGHALNPLVAEALEGVPADHFICKPTFGSTLLAEKLKTAVGTETPEIELVGRAPASVCCPMPSCAKRPSRKAIFPWTLPAAPASRPSLTIQHFLP